MDIKARSKAMREIVTRLVERARGGVEVKVFGDKVILDDGSFIPLFFISPTVAHLFHEKRSKIGRDVTC